MDNRALEMEADDSIDLQHYLMLLQTVLLKYYKYIIVLCLLSASVAYYYVNSAEASYTASVTMHLAPPDGGLVYWDRGSSYINENAFRKTQTGILKSRNLMTRVVKDLQLHVAEDSEEESGAKPDSPGLLSKIKNAIFSGDLEEPTAPPTEEDIIETHAIGISSSLAVSSLDDERASDWDSSSLVSISITWDEPQLAADIVNSVSKHYIEMLFEKEVEQSIQSQEFLTERLGRLRNDVRLAEEALQIFREQEDIVDSSSGRSESDSQLSSISNRFFEAQENRLRQENLYNQVRNLNIKGDDLENIPAIADHPRVSRTVQKLYNLQQTYSELSQRYGPRHNKMIALAAETNAAKQALQEQSRDVVASIGADFEFAKKNESTLKAALEDVRGKIQSTGRRDYELRDLQQDVDTKREVYTAFLDKLNQEDASGPVRNNNIWIVDPATAPKFAQLPSARNYVLAAILLSLIGSVGLGILIELNRNTILQPEEIETHLGITSLGMLPLITDTDDSEHHNLALNEYQSKQNSLFAEAIRSLRTTLLLYSQTTQAQRFIVTSTEAAEGKSSVALSLATSFSKVKNVILLDCDLRKPSLERALQNTSHRAPGITDLIAETATLTECIVELESGLHILYSGSRALNPLELIGSGKFNSMLNRLSESYDLIFIDSPPCLPVSDSYLLASLSDAAIFVIKSEQTKVTALRAVVKQFKVMDIEFAGGLLNQVDFDAIHARGYYNNPNYYDAYHDSDHDSDREVATEKV